MNNEVWNPAGHIKQMLIDRLANVITALNKGDRDECKCLMVSGMMSEDDFNDAWPDKKEEQKRVIFNKYGRFKVKGYWFELRPVFSHDPDYSGCIDLKGYILFAMSKTHEYDEPCSKVIDCIQDIEFEKLSDNEHWENIEVPGLVLGLAEDYILNLNKEKDDE